MDQMELNQATQQGMLGSLVGSTMPVAGVGNLSALRSLLVCEDGYWAEVA